MNKSSTQASISSDLDGEDAKQKLSNSSLQNMLDFVNPKDVNLLIQLQRQMLSRFEKTNEVLLNCNALAASRFEFVLKDMKGFRTQLADMKKDLDYIHKTIRVAKSKLQKKYPEAFASVQKEVIGLEDVEEEQEDENE